MALAAALLSAVAVSIVRAQSQSRHQLEQRFDLRAALGASFSSTFVGSIALAERARAQRTLAGVRVTDAQFQRAVDAERFQAAVLLDGQGRLLKVWPSKPALIGTLIVRKYAHLKAAVAGRIAVSNAVPSAVSHQPVVAIAVPYQTQAGRRVFSGAFTLGETPLATYLNTSIPISGGELFLVDARGLVVAANRSGRFRQGALSLRDPELVRAARGRDHGYYRHGGESRYFVRRSVAGTPWQLIVSAPRSQLLRPIEGWSSLLPWALLAALMAAAAGMIVLLARLLDERGRLAFANEELAAGNEKLLGLDRLKDEFVALVSHELRTPLTSIIGHVSLLLRGRVGQVPAPQRGPLEVVERNAHRLLGLVSDLVLSAKADAGKLDLELRDVDLDVLVVEAVESARPYAQERDVTMQVSCEGHARIRADRARIVQLVDNLLSNAIKFTQGGKVCIAVKQDGDQFLVEIADTGIGIPAAEQARLFERFFRASSATSREIQGSGLGLSVAKTIVELHAGTIECLSREGEGTTFRIWLPRGAVAAATAA